MNKNTIVPFDSIWDSPDTTFDFVTAAQQPRYCEDARLFAEWVETELRPKVSGEVDVVAVNQAKVLLQDKYFDLWAFVSKRHRDYLGSHNHVCIYRVYVSTYRELRKIELGLTPPMLFVPPPPPPLPRPPQIAGLVLGLNDDES